MEKFPIENLPSIVRELSQQAQSKLNFPVQYTAMSMLCAAAIAIGRTRVIRVNSTWVEKPIFFIAIIGDPGAIKTPAVSLAFRPLEKINSERIDQYNKAVAQIKKEAKDSGADALRPVFPRSGQLILKDSTLEALFKVHKSNPAGVGYRSDELTGWLGSMDKYRKGGNDVSVWLSIFNGEGMIINRKEEDEVVSLNETCVSVIGSIQPKVFYYYFHGRLRENGLLARILQVYDNDDGMLPYDSFDEMQQELLDRWASIVETLLKGRKEDDSQACIEYTLSEDAKQIYKTWSDRTTDRMNEEEPVSIREFFAKMKYYTYRFALVLQILYCCCGEEGRTREIGERAMKTSVKLCDFFLFMDKKTIEALDASSKLTIQPMRKVLYDSLPDSFTKEEANATARKLGISESTVDKLCKDEIGHTLRSTGRGQYEKVPDKITLYADAPKGIQLT